MFDVNTIFNHKSNSNKQISQQIFLVKYIFHLFICLFIYCFKTYLCKSVFKLSPAWQSKKKQIHILLLFKYYFIQRHSPSYTTFIDNLDIGPYMEETFLLQKIRLFID